MRRLLAMMVNVLFSHRKIIKNKIIFETGNYKQHAAEKYQTIWFVKKGADCADVDPKDIVYYRTWNYFYHLATAHFWIRSHSVGSLLHKRKGQIYIQTWHGGGAFKKCGYDISEAKERPPVEHVKEWDVFIASDPMNASMIQTSCGYQKDIKILGLPRSDDIVNTTSEQIIALRKKVLPHIGNDKKIILYAPTFRDSELENKEVRLPIEQLAALHHCIILIRLHPYVRNYLDTKALSENMVDVSKYPNVQDLLLISDCLVTDYSSIIFDYALLNRPMIFYTYDHDAYMKERTGFYLDYETDLPGIRVTSCSELQEYLQNDDLYSVCKESLEKFQNKYNKWNDGHVCERVLRFIETL